MFMTRTNFYIEKLNMLCKCGDTLVMLYNKGRIKFENTQDEEVFREIVENMKDIINLEY